MLMLKLILHSSMEHMVMLVLDTLVLGMLDMLDILMLMDMLVMLDILMPLVVMPLTVHLPAPILLVLLPLPSQPLQEDMLVQDVMLQTLPVLFMLLKITTFDFVKMD